MKKTNYAVKISPALKVKVRNFCEENGIKQGHFVEEALRHLCGRPATVADVGCGSGCIAVSLACELSESRIFATELSPEALAVARENAHRHGVEERIDFLLGDLLGPLLEKGPDGRLDAVVSNPPYVSDREMEALAPEVKEHEPRIALAAGPDGLAVIRRLVPQAERLLAPEGLLFFEIGQGLEAPVGRLLQDSAFRLEKVVPDLQGIPRVVMARKHR